jgi:8-oxo-dGTP pyrophosphatase MutT (NUDIX family)
MARQPAPTHAGGIVVRDSPSGPEYLIVEARREPGIWVLPKGHIEKAETPEAAAIREVEEEAGCKATILAPLGTLHFDDTRVVMFLMKHRKTVPRKETRKVFWGSYEQARKRLSFQDTRDLLGRAHAAAARRS